MSCSPSQDTLEALNEIELRTVTRQAIQGEVRLGREHFRNGGGLMPWRMVNSEDYGLGQRGWIRSRNVAQVVVPGAHDRAIAFNSQGGTQSRD